VQVTPARLNDTKSTLRVVGSGLFVALRERQPI
jgi:hypothetical protein